MKEREMVAIAQMINEVIEHHADALYLTKVKEKIEKLCSKFPIY